MSGYSIKLELFKQYIKLDEEDINYLFTDNEKWYYLPIEIKEKIIVPIIKETFSKNYKNLDKEFEFVNFVNKNNFIEVIKQIKYIYEKSENLQDGEQMNVRDSSVWAVCTAFLQYKGLIDTPLTEHDLYYTGNRCGMFGNLRITDLIEEFDGNGYIEWIRKF